MCADNVDYMLIETSPCSCILLMSLDKPGSIPVDRHVFAFAEKKYRIRSKNYEEIAEKLRALWGDYAGWAHSILFTADLRAFREYELGSSVKLEQVAQALHRLEDPILQPVKQETDEWGSSAADHPLKQEVSDPAAGEPLKQEADTEIHRPKREVKHAVPPPRSRSSNPSVAQMAGFRGVKRTSNRRSVKGEDSTAAAHGLAQK